MNPHAHRIESMVADVQVAASYLEHPWDRQAIDWTLSRRSVVVDVGGYTGRWAYQIATWYHPRLYVFEPQLWAAETCQALLGDAATVLPYGLGERDAILPMGKWETDGCSFLWPGDTPGEIREIGAAFDELGIKKIDLMMVNIEGYEHILLPHMIERGILPKRLVMQCHPFEDEGADMVRLFGMLKNAKYRVLWTYGAVLTAWERA